ncbi:MAG: DNA topoisomerase 4 subunit A [Patescibacteria group bacterium]|nr:DNA topoisomerase 4 subunit A [Patescibacteria group bacterium]
MKETIKSSEITYELKNSYLDYALSVIISRALPDVRDGLKPVQRRILYVMKELTLWPNEKFTKCANIVGNTIARYHPHGDQAVYETLVRLAQDFSLRHPLIWGQGNFGSLDGDPPAAYRYTEAKLSPIAVEMLADIDKDTVDFRPNYDNTRKEPIVLPSKLPNLIINGSLGIAVGMATSIPPHNLIEIGEGIKKIIKDQNISLKELLQTIKGPDFPTGGIIYGKKTLFEAYKTGKGSIVIRGKIKIEETKRGNKYLVITEIPWQVNKSELVRQIADLGLNKILPQIKEVRDESNREGIRIIIELADKEERLIQNTINKIYRLTDLQKNFYFNLIALENGLQPRVFDLKEILINWLNHRREVIRRRTKYDLEKTKERIEILEGFKKAIQNIDLVIKIIKKSPDKQTAKKNLISKLKINDRQAEAILEMPLRSLTSLETKKIIEELNEKLKLKSELEIILKYPKKIDELIIKEIDELIEKYGEKRKTQIIEEDIVNAKEDKEIIKEDILLFINQKKLVRSFKIDTPVEKIIKTKDEFGKLVLTNTQEKIFTYSQKGKFFTIPVIEFYENPKYLESTISLDKDEHLIDVFRASNQKNLICLTKMGLGKKIKIDDVLSNRKTGVQIIKLKGNDTLVKVLPLEDEQIIIFTQNGFSLGIKEGIPIQGRSSAGVKIIKLSPSDQIFNASAVNKNCVLIIFNNGYAKKFSIKEINFQKRGGRGIKIFDLKEKLGTPIFIDLVNNDDKIMVINEKIKTIPVKDIKEIKRTNQPIKLVEEKINSVILI